jgi:hypothetical protein
MGWQNIAGRINKYKARLSKYIRRAIAIKDAAFKVKTS